LSTAPIATVGRATTPSSASNKVGEGVVADVEAEGGACRGKPGRGRGRAPALGRLRRNRRPSDAGDSRCLARRTQRRAGFHAAGVGHRLPRR
jgi:hypothetical protein